MAIVDVREAGEATKPPEAVMVTAEKLNSSPVRVLVIAEGPPPSGPPSPGNESGLPGIVSTQMASVVPLRSH
jgi:hypothetical protein